ncbi:hypothetical protein DFH09DRAFT_1341874 [Mycena vulgaris]|nr:hypothetical protein DFH09DRAFT_1341874 [Mycena vulgaris]
MCEKQLDQLTPAEVTAVRDEPARPATTIPPLTPAQAAAVRIEMMRAHYLQERAYLIRRKQEGRLDPYYQAHLTRASVWLAEHEVQGL